jgi:LPS-assembly protein
MSLRTKRFITLLFLCHLFLLGGLLTSQGQAQTGVPAQTPAELLAGESGGEPVTIKAKEQEKDGDVYRLRGDVEIEFREYTVRAGEVTYDAASGQLTAAGNVSFDGGPHDEHIEASHGEYNVRSETGTFYDVVGSTGAPFRGKNVTLVTEAPFAFAGKVVQKVSRDRYVIHHGLVTSCTMPNPDWSFNAERVELQLGENATIYNSTLRLKKVPILYIPVAGHPMTAVGRQSGFLAPNFGSSSRKGTIIGDSFYWAINRSMDATIGAEYYSIRGWAPQAEFRARPTDKSFINATFTSVLDRGLGIRREDQGGQEVKLNGEALFPANVRGVVAADYLSSFVYRLAFNETFAQAVNSEVKSLAFLTKPYNGYFLSTSASRYQNFQSAVRGDVITIVRVPSFEVLTVDQQIARSKFYWSSDSTIDGVSRREPTFKTNDLVGRIDVQPRLSLPLFLQGWTFRPEVALRETYYTQRKSATNLGLGVPLGDPLNRRSIEALFEIRPPTLGRIFDRPFFGHTVKHTIEPYVVYRLVQGVTSFPNIIRFDERDILSDTNEFEYGITQRWFFKKADAEDCEPGKASCASPREFITWELSNKYFFDPDFGGAVVDGKRNVFTTTVEFTGIAFLTEPRRFAPVVSRLRLRPTSKLDSSWELDYDTVKTRISSSTLFVNYRMGDFVLGGSHAFLNAPGEIFFSLPLPTPVNFNQFRVMLGYGSPTKPGWSGTANIGFDASENFLQYGSFQGSYNWACYGLSMEYRRFALGTVRNENQFRFALTFANIGTFGNLKRQEKMF